MKNIHINIIIFLLFLFSGTSCREEVISPNNPVGNLNEPIIEKRSDFYSFSIYAKNITNSITENTTIKKNSTNFYFSLIDYSSGAVEVLLYNFGDIIFRKTASDDLPDFNTDLNGSRPDLIKINFINFSGKFKVQISGFQ